MAQADQTVQNATFPTVRADINNNLAALFSANSGNTAPTVTVAFQDWIDTSGTDPLWKKRNAANNAWITLGTIDGNDIAFEGTLPDQSGNSGKFLTTDGTDASWLAVPPGSQSFVYTSNDTWVKPSDGNFALVTIWGGGGSGGRQNSGGGGGGGACVQRLYRLSELAATVSITIGAGGAAQSLGSGNVGGNTTFGALLTAYGGGGGSGAAGNATATTGGGGGGSLSAGGVGTAGTGHSAVLRGGAGSATPGSGDFGGAGGGNGGTAGASGASAYWGGGGGGGRGSGGTGGGGISLHGGNGGAASSSTDGEAGSLPGGGGGATNSGTISGAGGAGYCLIYVW